MGNSSSSQISTKELVRPSVSDRDIRLLRLVVQYVDASVLAKLECICFKFQQTMLGMDWRWRQLCTAELPVAFQSKDASANWRQVYYGWQPALRLVHSHTYYKNLELHENESFLRVLRKDLTARKLVEKVEVQQAALEHRTRHLKPLAELASAAAAAAAEVCKCSSDAGPKQHSVLDRRRRQLREYTACLGCGSSFGEVQGPFVYECNHGVCIACLQVPECPRCRQMIKSVPNPGDPELVQWAARYAAVALRPSDGQGFVDVQRGLFEEALPRWSSEAKHISAQVSRFRESLLDAKLTCLINKAYQRLLLVKHPDHGGLHEEFLAIQEAHQVLKCGAARSVYNSVSHAKYVFSTKGSSSTASEGRSLQRPRQMMIMDSRPAMPPMPELSLVPFCHQGLYGSQIHCECRRARGAEATKYVVEWQANGDSEWTSMAIVGANAVQRDRFIVNSGMVVEPGQCLVRVTAGNDNGWGRPSSVAAINVVVGAETGEERSERVKAELAQACAAEAEEVERRERQMKNSLRQRQAKKIGRISKATAELDGINDWSGPLGILALVELREALESAGVDLVSPEVAYAKEIIEKNHVALASFETCPERERVAILRKARAQRRIRLLQSELRKWWSAASLTVKLGVARISLGDFEDLISERVPESKIETAAEAYREWQAEATDTIDELGLMWTSSSESGEGEIRISASLLAEKDERLWVLLDGMGLMPPPLQGLDIDLYVSNDDIDDDEGESPKESDGKDLEFEADVQNNSFTCISRAFIQMLALEAFARQVCETAAATNPRIRRLWMRGATQEPEDGHEPEEKDGVAKTNASFPRPVSISEAGENEDAGSSTGLDFVACRKQKLQTESVHGSQKSNNGREKKSKPAPARNAFQCFCLAAPQFAVNDVRQLKSMWKALSASEREIHEAEAVKEAEQYQVEMEKWEGGRALAAHRGRKGRQGRSK